ncbi:preprotein translocase subunit SecD [Halocatena pleomorpha]|uniref:Protein-export membrane protein SecD n=1 Tax=Halocatena pleomorpha TaxID=1785090 RepID=A0A3P3RER8_9EURY|nr:preprotein translocase subunit SecD [Halocatena pleomorpha]RRJ32006.1 preprotein translocase subunit SecD [Halocatena pleomorpha]
MSRNFSLRENWRIVLLVLIVLGSAVSIFAPVGNGGSAQNATVENASESATAGPTNLQFGLELSGGTRIRAPLVGMTAEDVGFNGSDPQGQAKLERALTNELSLSPQDVRVQPTSQNSGTVEVFNENVTQEEFARALQNQGKDVQTDDIRDGVTDKTLETAEGVLDRKVTGAGLSGGEVSISRSTTGDEAFIVVEVPNKQPEEVVDLIDERGTVLVVAHFPVEQNGTKTYRNVQLFTQEGIKSVDPADQPRGGRPGVPITLKQDAAKNFSNAMREFGFLSQPPCTYAANKNDSGHCLYTVSNGKVVNGTITKGEIVSAASMGDLSTKMKRGDFVDDPRFRITSANLSEAQNLALDMRAGALPTTLNIDEGTSTYIQPSLAEKFKLLSLVTGLFTMLAVAGTVAYRYREPRIAVPMVVTAAAEVFILLGFSAAIGLAIDLSHIAGFIAVIGTGVDDLVIIADEILQQGDVSTNRVFRSRFRKAFWVIGAAAATTIVAMLPLAALSLGDLQGFALITIVGVLVGVLITRPAYGDVIRNLVLD